MTTVFVILPCVSYALMNKKISVTNKKLSQIAHDLTAEQVIEWKDEAGISCFRHSLSYNIKVLDIKGARTSKGLLSVSPVAPTRGSQNIISLNLEASAIKIKKDTLFININDDSRIYQGFIRIRGLQTYILNNDTIKFR